MPNKTIIDSGIELIGEVPWGTHFCQFYETGRDLLDILLPYFTAGLENNEFCMWIVSDPISVPGAKEALRKTYPRIDECIENGQIEILPYDEWYVQDGVFDQERVLNGWIEKLNAALARGFAGLRLSGNTTWLQAKDWQTFKDYEAAIDSMLGRYRIMALCTYYSGMCGVSEVTDVVSNHKFALIRREGRWETIESGEYRRSEEKIRYQNAVLDGINQVFRASLSCQTEQELGRKCLSVAEDVTQSKFGFIAELTDEGGLYDIAISSLGWHACEIRDPVGHGRIPIGLDLHGVHGQVLSDGRGFFTNDPASHPSSRGYPEGHPHIESFLGAPLIQGGKTIGLIAVGNREGGYRDQDLSALEALASAIVQVIMRKRVEDERERLLEEVSFQKRQAEEAVKARDEFISIASHELRTPVTSMLGFAQLAIRRLERDGKLDADKGRQSLETIEQQSKKLANLVNKLLDISRIEAGRLVLEPRPTDVAELVERVVTTAQIGASNLAITLDLPPTFVATVDPLRLEQVVTNLIDNAIKYGNGTDIQVGLSPSEENMEIFVKDNGPGIPVERRDALFTRFYQAHDSRQSSGMGLGLYISSQIAALHGGAIKAEFPEDGGTMFVVVLPVGSGFTVLAT